MRPLTLLLLVLILTPFISFSQTATGIVQEENSQPVSYATIQIGENYGVVTNEDGQFSIDTSKFKETDLATISFIGYRSLLLTVQELRDQEVFTLSKDLMTLDQVFLTNKKFTPEELLEKVIAYRDTNYTKEPTKRKVFLRNSTVEMPQKADFEFKRSSLLSKSKLKQINKEMESKESIIKGSWSNNYKETLAEYYSSDNSSKTNPLKSTILINKNKDVSADNLNKEMMDVIKSHLSTDRTYKVKSGLIPVADSLEIESAEDEKKPLSKDLNSNIDMIVNKSNIYRSSLDFIYEPKKYSYSLESASNFDNEIVYKLSFIPESRSAKYEGNLYINAQDFSIMKMEYKIVEGKDGSKMNLKLLLGVKFVEQEANYLITYKKDSVSNKYRPSLIKTHSQTYVYLNRPMKFTQNKIDEDEDKKMLKFNIMVETISKSDQELFFLDLEPIVATTFEQFEQPENYEIQYLKAYDASLWKDYNIIAPINALKEYQTE